MSQANPRQRSSYHANPIETLEGRLMLSSVASSISSAPFMIAEVRQADYLVRTSNAQTAATVTVAAPTTPVLSPASDSGTKGDDITNVTKPTFTGTAPAAAKVTIFSGTTVIGSATAASSGAYSVTATVALANGTHSITATATKGTVTSSKSGTLHLTILTTPPAAPSTPVLKQLVANVATFKGTAATGATVTIYANSKVVGTGTASGGAYAITATALVNGTTYSIYATATNVAGDVSVKSGTLSLKVVVIKSPSVPTLAPASDSGVKGDHITNVVKPTFTGTATEGATVKILSGTTVLGSGTTTTAGTWSVTITTALANGAHSITATATSGVSTSAPSAALSLTIQTTPPAAPAEPAIVSAATLTPTFTGAAPAGDTVTIYADNKAVGTGIATGGHYSIAVSALAGGKHLIAATATDFVGNISAKSATLPVDLGTAPKIVYSYVTNQSSYTTTPGGTVTVEVFLEETLIGGAKSLITSDGGLEAAGFSVSRAATLPASPAALTGIDGSVSSNGSNFGTGSFSPAPADSASFQGGDNLVSLSAKSGPVPNAKDSFGFTDLIEIGSVTIVAGSSGTTQFTLANFAYPSTTGGYTLTFNNNDLDTTQTGANAFTGASASPETFSVTVN